MTNFHRPFPLTVLPVPLIRDENKKKRRWKIFFSRSGPGVPGVRAARGTAGELAKLLLRTSLQLNSHPQETLFSPKARALCPSVFIRGEGKWGKKWEKKKVKCAGCLAEFPAWTRGKVIPLIFRNYTNFLTLHPFRPMENLLFWFLWILTIILVKSRRCFEYGESIFVIFLKSCRRYIILLTIITCWVN